MLKKILALIGLSTFIGFILHAQNRDLVSVNPNTGLATTVIQLHSLSRGDVVFPISIAYSSKGIKVQEGHGTAGMGWQLITGGSISRNLRGLPDDYNYGATGNNLKGWLYNSCGSLINSFTVQNDNSSGTCTDETNDINYLKSNFYNTDTEPDIFSVTAPGLTCQFVFDNNKVIRTIPYKDLKITYTTDYTGQINAFTVVNDKGISYVFSEVETVSRSAVSGLANINFFKTDFNLYRSAVNYNSEWHLSNVRDAKGNGVVLNYNDDGSYTSSNPIVLTQDAPGSLNQKITQYSMVEIHNNRKILSSVRSAKDTASVSFVFSSFHLNEPVIQEITAGGKDILFNYESVSNAIGYRRFFLTGVQDRVKAYPLKYNFSYSAYTTFSVHPNTAILLPDTSSKQIDYWGYYTKLQTNTSLAPSLYINPSGSTYPRYKVKASADAGSAYTYAVTGAERAADPAYAAAGTLEKITYEGGGTTTIAYELNDYYDPTTSTVIKGGGLRVKSIVDYDGISTANNITKTYNYNNPATGLTSGNPITLPIYGFTRPYTGTGTTAEKWNYSTVKSENDLSNEDESILYSHVKVSQPGAGSTLYEYSKPGVVWDVSTIPDWSPTVGLIARTNCSSTDFTKNDIYSYPFAPNTNYDFERGLLKKTTGYNGSGQQVSESVFTYARTGTPVVVNALKIDTNMSSVAYAKYTIYTTCEELIAQETKKIFDSQTLSQQHTSTTNYYYESAQHKLITRQTATNSDGSVSTTQIAYTKDYTIPVTTDANLLAMKNLQLKNINVPVETQSKVQRGGTTRTVAASLTTFLEFPGWLGSLYLPSQALSFVSENGITDFQPLAVNTGALVKDSRYMPKVNYTKYDVYGNLLSKDDNNRNRQSMFMNRFVGLPSINIIGASYDELAFQDFESPHNGTFFNYSGTSYTSTTDNHTGTQALLLNAGSPMTATIKKSADAVNYIFSCWIKATSAGTVTVSLTNGGSTGTYNLSFASGADKFRYYELKIPASGFSSSTAVSFQSNAQIKIDDIILYPDNASTESFTYDVTRRQKSSETNVNGITTYYNYDPYGRLNTVMDQDRQIILSKSYLRSQDIVTGPPLPYASLNFSGDNPYNNGLYPQRPVYFTNTTGINNPDADDMVYTWNFGDGSAVVTGFNSTHTYASAGTYTVVLTATSVKYGLLTYSKAVTILPAPAATVNLTYTNWSSGGALGWVRFYQGGTLITSTKGPFMTLGGVYIVPAVYDVEVNISGTASNYNSFTYKGKEKICFDYNVGGVYTFTVDLRGQTTADFKIDINTCGSTAINPN